MVLDSTQVRWIRTRLKFGGLGLDSSLVDSDSTRVTVPNDSDSTRVLQWVELFQHWLPYVLEVLNLSEIKGKGLLLRHLAAFFCVFIGF